MTGPVAPDDELRTPAQRSALEQLARDRDAIVNHIGYDMDVADTDADHDGLLLLFWLSDGAHGKLRPDGTLVPVRGFEEED